MSVWPIMLVAICTATAAAPGAPEVRKVQWQAISEREPSLAVARRQAQQRLLEAAREALEARWGASPEPTATHLLTILRQMPEVQWQEAAEEEATEYGLMHRYRIAVRMEPQALDLALDRLAAAWRRLWTIRLAAAGATLAFWLAVGWAAVRLDRWTQGYRRAIIALGVLLVGAWGTAAIWYAAVAWGVPPWTGRPGL